MSLTGFKSLFRNGASFAISSHDHPVARMDKAPLALQTGKPYYHSVYYMWSQLLTCLVLLTLGTVTTVGLKRKVVDRTELDRSLCTETDTSFQEEFGIPYSQPNCDLFMYENQYPNW